jgi:hypothetical protein
MAVQLIREWRLAVLRVALDLAGRTATVRLSLSSYADGNPAPVWAGAYSVEDFGITSVPPYDLTVPTDVVAAIENSMAEELQSETALWIHLVPTYGLLGAVPWERALADLAAPVLRVPNRLPMPVVRGRVWLGAIAIDGGPHGDWAAPYVRSLVGAWRDVIPARVEVDVFADARTARDLRTSLGDDAAVRVHDPRDAVAVTQHRIPRASAAPSTTTKLSPSAVGGSIWADWIAEGLAGRATRGLHVVLDGSWDGGEPVLLISHDPAHPTKRASADMVGVTDLMRFVQSVGAATVSFGAPPTDWDEPAVRLFADSIGQLRPGATLFSSIAEDPSGSWLAAAEAFLVDSEGGRPVPRHRSLFAYVQPERLRLTMPGRERGLPDAPTVQAEEGLKHQDDPTLADRYATSDVVPSWVASSDQYLGSQWDSLVQNEVVDVSTEPSRLAYDQGARDALQQIRAIVDRHARPT